MSYSLRIEARDWLDDEPATALGGDEDAESSFLAFSAGNPRVEHVTGVVHLYRHLGGAQQKPPEALLASPSSSGPSGAIKGAPGPATFAQTLAGVTPAPQPGSTSSTGGGGSPAASVDTLCCLAIPGDMSVAEFCTFCGAYLTHIREMRVLRREASARTVCMVLVRFDTPEHAQSYYDDFHNKPFCSLEPEILCRLVHVKSVELLDRPDKAPAVSAAATAAAAATSSTSGGGAAASAASAAGASSSRGGSGGGGGSSEIQPAPADSRASSSSAGITASLAGIGGKARKGKQQPKAQPQPQLPPPHGNAAPCSSPSSSHTSSQHPATSASCQALLLSHTSLPPPPGTTELPSCPVCLERLDYHVSGIITTVCNHQFHSECLQKWGDTSCPVCRYCSQPGSHTSRCSVCSTASDLWICLICGHVGCGRYKAGHASDHWQGSQHCYALELDTQRVWDYAGDNYVHRLIQSKTDGKLVEVPSPAETGAAARGTHRGARHQRSACGGAEGHDGSGALHEDREEGYFGPEDEGLKEALIASKLDSIAQDYNHLITTQLDSQRQYFEGLLAAAAKDAEHRVAAAEADAAAARAAAAEAASQAKEAERKRQAAEKKLVDVSSSLQKADKERDFLRSLNETLLSNQQDFQKQLAAAKLELAAKAEANRDLQEQVRDLMVYIEAQRLVEASGEDLQQATVLPVPEPQRGRAGAQRQGKGKQGGK